MKNKIKNIKCDMKDVNLQYEASVEFVQSALIFIYKDYVNAMIYVRENEEDFNKLDAVAVKYTDLKESKKEFEKAKKKFKDKRDPKFIYLKNQYYKEKLRLPPKLTRKETVRYKKYLERLETIYDTERFYKSRRFKILTLEADINPQIIIDKARKEAKNNRDGIRIQHATHRA